MKRKNRLKPEIDTGMFADVSFLLMIFFMVVTSFHKNYSIDQALPPPSEKKEEFGVDPDRVLSIMLNKDNRFLINERIFEDVRQLDLSPDIYKIGTQEKYGIIRFTSDTLARYDAYLDVLALIKRGKRGAMELWAKNHLQKDLNDLTPEEGQHVSSAVRVKLLELSN